jgi:hypothetical protein
MSTLRFEIDCTENGPTGHNMTGEPLSSLKPYLYGISIKGSNDTADMNAEETEDANFNVIEMTDVRLVQQEDDITDDPAVTIYFRAIIEFNLEFDPDSDYGGRFYKRILDEANWIIEVSSDTMGLQTSDGNMDDDSFDGIWDPVSVLLKDVKN